MFDQVAHVLEEKLRDVKAGEDWAESVPRA
jgi:hypothetical protein